MEKMPTERGAALVLICICGLAVFHNSFDNSFHYDDEHSIVENPHIRSLGNLPRFFIDPGMFSGLPEARMYRPLVLSSYALNYAIGGYQVGGYHLVNLLFHLINGWLVWELGRRLLGGGKGALLAALLFVVHPLASEPVNYISSRSSLLAGLFYLLALLFLVRMGEERGRWGKGLGMGGSYLAGLCSKAVAFSFPLVGWLYLHLVERRRAWNILAVPLALSGLYLLGTRSIVGPALRQPVRAYGMHLATQLKGMAFYLWKAIVPVHLSVEPQFRVAQSWVEGPVLLAGGLLVSLLWIGFRGRQREGLLVFFGAWFFLALLPSALVPLHVLVNEHRLYLSMAGATLGLGGLIGNGKRQVQTIWVAILLILGVQCALHNRVWSSEETLWANAVARESQMARPHVNLGKAYLEKGDHSRAIAASEKGLEIDPNQARAHYNIGTAHLQMGDGELAIAHYRRTLEIQPDLVEARNNLGNAFQERGRYEEAVQAYREALAVQIHPSFYHNLGSAFLEWDRADSARVYFRKGLELDPDMRESYRGLANACLEEDLLQTALQVLQEARERWPHDVLLVQMVGDVHAAMGMEEAAVRAYRQSGKSDVEIWLQLGKRAAIRSNWEKARGYYQRALLINEGDGRVHNGLGEVELGVGDMGAALQAFRQALRLNPELAPAYANIGRVYLKHGRGLEAVAALEKAAGLIPEDAAVRDLLREAHRLAGK
jgi:protein O-mannosyl-transferase